MKIKDKKKISLNHNILFAIWYAVDLPVSQHFSVFEQARLTEGFAEGPKSTNMFVAHETFPDAYQVCSCGGESW